MIEAVTDGLQTVRSEFTASVVHQMFNPDDHLRINIGLQKRSGNPLYHRHFLHVSTHQLPHITNLAGHCCCGSHRRAGQMCTRADSLAPDEISIASRYRTLPRADSITVRGQTERTSRLAPLEPRVS